MDTNPQLFFHLQQQRLIELIRNGKVEEALEFAQEELAPRGEENVIFILLIMLLPFSFLVLLKRILVFANEIYHCDMQLHFWGRFLLPLYNVDVKFFYHDYSFFSQY